jgi:acetyl esterase/lipase
MGEIPVGYLITVVIMAWLVGWAVAPVGRPRLLAQVSFYSGLVVNEVPFIALAYLIASTALAFAEGDIASPGAWAIVALAGLTALGLVVIIVRGLRAIPALRRALDEGLGAGWRDVIGQETAGRLRPRFHASALLGPLFVRRGEVERIPNLSYGPAGRRNLLDVYRHRTRPNGAPVLVHFHGGAFRQGDKNREALPLIYRMAARGWVVVSATYRLMPAATIPDALVDAKRAVAWVREHIHQYGGDPSTLIAAGGSAGGQLAAQLALTPNDARHQPGFEGADATVSAAVPLYGYFGWLNGGFLQELSPALEAMSGEDIPPFFILAAEYDTVVPVPAERQLAGLLRGASRNPVLYAELPGAQHNFDLFHSIRSEAAVDAIAAFAEWVREDARDTGR